MHQTVISLALATGNATAAVTAIAIAAGGSLLGCSQFGIVGSTSHIATATAVAAHRIRAWLCRIVHTADFAYRHHHHHINLRRPFSFEYPAP